ncbi:hypothetical protein GIB67_002275 [Kingdonia uniflora]|uniref:Uncharacterized protein n=1 Tax=Kingdonia uniflora TaxID=39325 RepID=A0A7J7KX77_9MAGN|nr:hypothetical protein GIB67_002275 [Kingdonia uniflora]
MHITIINVIGKITGYRTASGKLPISITCPSFRNRVETISVILGVNLRHVYIAGTPDFAEVYNFIGSVFDPDTEGHLQKLQDMDPINFETVLSLMRNLTINLSSPEFEPIEKVLSAYAFHGKAAGNTKE